MNPDDVVLHRDWWLPFIVTVWTRIGDGVDARRGPYVTWLRKPRVFFRRSSAERYRQGLIEGRWTA